MLQKQLLRFIESLRRRRPLPLRIELWDGSGADLGAEPAVTVRLRRASAARHFLTPTFDGLGQAYVEGEIDVEGSLRDVMAVADNLTRLSYDKPMLGSLPTDWLARHTRTTDRKAIEHHYDVSNEFYALWLDPQMVYSCAYFPTGGEDVATAQQRKLDHICRKLQLAPGMRMLDIGCGWGALSIHAARHYGAKVTGITLSSNQHQWASERVKREGLQDQVEIRIQDYRDVPGDGVFDRISSVGMFEHVGLAKLNEYFAIVHRLLVRGGIALNHGITSADPDSRGTGYGGGDFIDRYVFPDGELPHVSLAIRELSASGLELTDAESLRRHYARTLWLWSDAFEANLPKLVELAGEQRTRIWRMYLAGCAYAFAHGWLNIYQLQAVRTRHDADGAHSPLPMSREYLYTG